MWSPSASDEEEVPPPGCPSPTLSEEHGSTSKKRPKRSEAEDNQPSSKEPQAGPSSRIEEAEDNQPSSSKEPEAGSIFFADDVLSEITVVGTPESSVLGAVGGDTAVNSSADIVKTYKELIENFKESGSRKSVQKNLEQDVKKTARLFKQLALLHKAGGKDPEGDGNNVIPPNDLRAAFEHTSLMSTMYTKIVKELGNNSDFDITELLETLKNDFVDEQGEYDPTVAAENIAMEAATSSKATPTLTRFVLPEEVGGDLEDTTFNRKQGKQSPRKNDKAVIPPPVDPTPEEVADEEDATPEASDEDSGPSEVDSEPSEEDSTPEISDEDATPEVREEPGPDPTESAQEMFKFVKQECRARGGQGVPIVDVVRADNPGAVVQRLFDVAQLSSEGLLSVREDAQVEYIVNVAKKKSNEAGSSSDSDERGHFIVSWPARYIQHLAQTASQPSTSQNCKASAPPEKPGTSDAPGPSNSDATSDYKRKLRKRK